MAPIRRRTAATQLGRIGHSTLGNAAASGSHDTLIGRLLGQGGVEFDKRPGRPQVGSWRLTGSPVGNRVTFVKKIAPTIWDREAPSTGTVTVRFAASYTAIEGEDFEPLTVVQIVPWNPVDGAAPAYLDYDADTWHACGDEHIDGPGRVVPHTTPFDMPKGIPHVVIVTTWPSAYPDPDFIVTSSVRAL